MLPRRLTITTALLRRSTVAGTPTVRSLIPRRLLATPPASGSDEQVDETLSIPRIAGIPIANNYETGVSGYNHPDPEMVGPCLYLTQSFVFLRNYILSTPQLLTKYAHPRIDWRICQPPGRETTIP